MQGFRQYLRRYRSERRLDIEGLAIFDAKPEDVEKLTHMLRRISSVAPRALERLRDWQVILFVDDRATMCYNPYFNSIAIPRQDLATREVDVMACGFVHEATHARVARSIRCTRQNLERVEHVCQDQELAMLERLVVAGTDIDVIHYLTWWRRIRIEPNASHQFRQEFIKKELERLKPPRFLQWLIYRLNGISPDPESRS